MQIAAYWSYEMWMKHKKKVIFDVDNFVLLSDELIKTGNELGARAHYCPLVYDEAGEALEGTKSMSKETKQVTDYLRECGQYNFLNILVLPEFFSLPRGIALTRSIALIDVTYTSDAEGKFQRGYFRFFSRKAKKKLYLNGKKDLNYYAASHNFKGRFYKFYPIDEDKYRLKKVEALRAREAKTENREKTLLFTMWHYLMRQSKMSAKSIAEHIYEDYYGVKLNPRTVSTNVRKVDEMIESRWDNQKEEREAKIDKEFKEEEEKDEEFYKTEEGKEYLRKMEERLEGGKKDAQDNSEGKDSVYGL